MNLKQFRKRLIAFYTCWRKQNRDLWENSDVLVICTPPSDSPENLTHPISSFFLLWLLGHDFPDTIAVFSRNEINFICGKRKFFSLAQTLESPAMEAVNAKVVVRMKSKGDNGLESMDEIIRGIRVSYNEKGDSNENFPLVVGYVSGESPKLQLLCSCFNNLKQKEFQTAHVSGFSRLLNHDQDVRYSGKSRERRDSRFFEESSSDYNIAFGSHQRNCAQIQMQSLPDDFEQMLALTPERREEATGGADDQKLQLEKGKGENHVIIHNEAEKSSCPKEVEESSSKHGLVSGEEEEWVLVEDDGKEEYMGTREKVNVWKGIQSMALAHYRL